MTPPPTGTADIGTSALPRVTPGALLLFWVLHPATARQVVAQAGCEEDRSAPDLDVGWIRSCSCGDHQTSEKHQEYSDADADEDHRIQVRAALCAQGRCNLDDDLK